MDNQSNRSFSGLLDSLVDKDGFKTDLTVSIPRQNLLEICGFLLGTVAIGSVVWFSVKTLFNRIQSP